MIEGYDIICFSNDWDGDPLSKKQIMSRLARKNRILWVNSIGNRNPRASARDFKRIAAKVTAFAAGCRKVSDNIHTISPLAIPFHGNALARRINRMLLVWTLKAAARRMGFRRPITWTFIPSSADVVGRLGERMVIYHCTDEFSEFTGSPKKAILDIEQKLIAAADRVIVCSERLYRSKVKHNPATWLVQHGVDVEHFRQACDPQTKVPADLIPLRHPVIGFFGLIADWVDLPLIRSLAIARPQWSFVMIGKSDIDLMPYSGVPNMHFLGQRPYAELPAYCRGFDVALLPFAINELTLNANPLKLREYLAAGLPVVSSAVPEVERFAHLVRIARSPNEFLTQIDDILQSGEIGPRQEVSKAMDAESWDNKVEEMSRVVAGAADNQARAA